MIVQWCICKSQRRRHCLGVCAREKPHPPSPPLSPSLPFPSIPSLQREHLTPQFIQHVVACSRTNFRSLPFFVFRYASPGSGFSDSSSVSGDFDNIRLGQASPGIPLAARPASPGPPHREEDESDSVSEFLSDVDDTLSTGERQCIARKRRRDSDDSDCSER